MMRYVFSATIALLAFGAGSDAAVAQVAPVDCSRYEAADGSTHVPQPIGDRLGDFTDSSGTTAAAEPVDILALTLPASDAPFAWIYIDQRGYRWINVLLQPPGLVAADLGLIDLPDAASTVFIPPAGLFDPKKVTLHRCRKVPAIMGLPGNPTS